MSAKRYTFSTDKRIRSRADFSAVFERGIKHSRGPLTAFALPTDRPSSRLGLAVPRRVGTAPRRNRIKRLLRESFRLMQHDFARPYDLILLVRPHEPLAFCEYQRLLIALLSKLHSEWTKKPQIHADERG